MCLDRGMDKEDVVPVYYGILHACVLSHFSRVQLFATLWTVARLALLPWDSPGKNTGVGCRALLQGIFLTQRSNPHLVCLLHWQAGSLPLLLLLLSHFSRVRLCMTPERAAHQAPPSLGFSRQEHWSGLPFPSPMHESEK